MTTKIGKGPDFEKKINTVHNCAQPKNQFTKKWGILTRINGLNKGAYRIVIRRVGNFGVIPVSVGL